MPTPTTSTNQSRIIRRDPQTPQEPLRRDRIVMVVAETDNMQHHADFAKRLVAETNQAIEGDYFRRIDEHFDREKRRTLEEFDTIQSLKARVKDIRPRT